LQNSFKNTIVSRFELIAFYNNFHSSLDLVPKEVLRALNILFSQITTVNNQSSELHYFTTLRLYLIKSYKGKAHALGKPVKGQRTWSNAWTAYNNNRLVRNSIRAIQQLLNKNYKEEKKNYTRLVRKYKKKTLTKLSAKKAKKLFST
jgi:hypothetical protein